MEASYAHTKQRADYIYILCSHFAICTQCQTEEQSNRTAIQPHQHTVSVTPPPPPPHHFVRQISAVLSACLLAWLTVCLRAECTRTRGSLGSNCICIIGCRLAFTGIAESRRPTRRERLALASAFKVGARCWGKPNGLTPFSTYQPCQLALFIAHKTSAAQPFHGMMMIE